MGSFIATTMNTKARVYAMWLQFEQEEREEITREILTAHKLAYHTNEEITKVTKKMYVEAIRNVVGFVLKITSI